VVRNIALREGVYIKMKTITEKKIRYVERMDNDLSQPKFMYGGVPVEDILDELNKNYFEVQYTAEDIGTNIFYLDTIMKISNKNDINVNFKICVGGWAIDHGYFPKLKKLSKNDVVNALENFKSNYVVYIRYFDAEDVEWYGNISFYKYLEFLATSYAEEYAIAEINGHYFMAFFK
jgi:hypothetical protein